MGGGIVADDEDGETGRRGRSASDGFGDLGLDAGGEVATFKEDHFRLLLVGAGEADRLFHLSAQLEEVEGEGEADEGPEGIGEGEEKEVSEDPEEGEAAALPGEGEEGDLEEGGDEGKDPGEDGEGGPVVGVEPGLETVDHRGGGRVDEGEGTKAVAAREEVEEEADSKASPEGFGEGEGVVEPNEEGDGVEKPERGEEGACEEGGEESEGSCRCGGDLLALQRSVGSARGDEGRYRLCDDFEVEEEGGAAGIFFVEGDPFGVGEVAAPQDLPEAGEAGADAEGADRFATKMADHLLADEGAGADDAQVAAQDIPKLGQLVEGVTAQESPHARGSGIVLQFVGLLPFALQLWIGGEELGEPRLCVGVHRAELVAAEGATPSADPLLSIEDGPSRGELDEEGDQEEEGGEGD